MEMIEKFYLGTWKSVLGSSIFHYCSKRSRFLKIQEAKGLLSSLRIKTPLSNIPLLGKILVWFRLDIKWIK